MHIFFAAVGLAVLGLTALQPLIQIRYRGRHEAGTR